MWKVVKYVDAPDQEVLERLKSVDLMWMKVDKKRISVVENV